ncbi:hypothetical protein NIES22_57820 [Calothrix brevissima NIES-22]|nr:hypothetical protein NIES22_57820 [Calothrix brevissima NIES-22]
MKNVKLSKLWDQLHSSYWFIPAVMAVAATALAFIMLNLDRSGNADINVASISAFLINSSCALR